MEGLVIINFGIFMAIWNILQPFGIFNGRFVIL
jgi:hypothetical protein